jgi:multiple sugar transport system permease protein
MTYQSFSIPIVGDILQALTGSQPSVNLINDPLAFYIPAALGVGIRSGLYIFIFRQFFRGVPKELEEAATVDGCGVFKTFLRIMVPNSGAAFLTVFLFSIVWYWNDFFQTSMLMTGRSTLAVALSSLRLSLRLQGVDIYDPFMLTTRLQAGALVTVLPLLIMYIVLQKYFTESVERTGIVG